MILGCDRPLVFRPQWGGRYCLVGDCFVYGLHDATALLGELPKPWVVQKRRDQFRNEIRTSGFFNTETGAWTREDPRLDPDPDWERIDIEDLGREPSGEDPDVFDFFRHRETGEMRDSDPRLLPEALRKRGVELEAFKLV